MVRGSWTSVASAAGINTPLGERNTNAADAIKLSNQYETSSRRLETYFT